MYIAKLVWKWLILLNLWNTCRCKINKEENVYGGVESEPLANNIFWETGQTCCWLLGFSPDDVISNKNEEKICVGESITHDLYVRFEYCFLMLWCTLKSFETHNILNYCQVINVNVCIMFIIFTRFWQW